MPYDIVWVTPYVNTKLVKETDWPTSLQDLLKPQWKGKIVLSDPRTGSGAYRYYIPFVRLGIIDWEYVKTLGKQEATLAQNNTAAMQVLAKGEALLTPYNTSGPNVSMVEAGSPVKAISMKEGDLFDLNSFSALYEGPHPNATKVFINWFFSKEGQLVYANAAKHNPVRKDTPNLTPKDVLPPNPNVKKIEINNKDTEEAEKLLKEAFIAQMMGLKR